MQSIADGFKDLRQREHPDFSIPCPNTVGAQGIAPGRTAVRPYSNETDNSNIHTIIDHGAFSTRLQAGAQSQWKGTLMLRGRMMARCYSFMVQYVSDWISACAGMTGSNNG